ncbi:hypothetical protein D9Q98_008614 [Chlorella vulgaris]|uniref:Uncharacterized protein n=1 Tax=Chlorella vulgaris TaxID=3077 RepID=A0A9D4YTW6_CHLVU|nr:hypothetical protein D9Q98_008614 [Chlorella vulgaris]
MPTVEPLFLAGSLAGIAGLTFASFTAVSYFEVKRKIDEQIARGEDPYELRVEKRAQPPRKPSNSGGGKKKGGGSKRKK